jgi:hypothetical protein
LGITIIIIGEQKKVVVVMMMMNQGIAHESVDMDTTTAAAGGAPKGGRPERKYRIRQKATAPENNTSTIRVPLRIEESQETADRLGLLQAMLLKSASKVPAYIASHIRPLSPRLSRTRYTILSVKECEGGVQDLRSHIRKACIRSLVPYVRSILEDAEKHKKIVAMSVIDRDAIVLRCVSQMADLAIYNTTPYDTLTYRKRSASRAAFASKSESYKKELAEALQKFRESTRYRNQREHDAKDMALLRSGKHEGPLASSNTVYQDFLANLSLGTSVSDPEPNAASYDQQVQTVVAMLIEATTTPPDSVNRGANFVPKERFNAISQILYQCRTLSVHEGVLVKVQARNAYPNNSNGQQQHVTVKLVLLASEANGICGRDGQDAVDALLEEWRNERKSEMSNPHGLRVHTIFDDSNGAVAGGGGGIITDKLTPLDVGYECPNRFGYYRSPEEGAYQWDHDDVNYEKHHIRGIHCLPARAYVPVSRGLQYVYLTQNAVRFTMASCFRTIPDILMPTSPMINLLLEGAMPYHMGSHAMLDQYTMLLWVAMERVCPKELRPVVVSQDTNVMQREDRARGLRELRLEHQYRVARVMDMFRAARSHSHEARPLPEWCGKWFVPYAYMPRVTTQVDLDHYYAPENINYRRHVGDKWAAIPPDNADMPTGVLTILENIRYTMQTLQKKEIPTATKKIGDEKLDKKLLWLSKRDDSYAGVAEYVMTLALMAGYYDMMDAWNHDYNIAVAALRANNEDGNTRGIRSQRYYDEFWKLCVKWSARLLEIHEVTILMLNSRWVDVNKAERRMVSQEARTRPDSTANANPDAAHNVSRRHESNMRYQTLILGSERVKGLVEQINELPWMQAQVAEDDKRPGRPTYLQLAVFDIFHEEIPLVENGDAGASPTLCQQEQHMEVDSGSGGLMNDLIERTRQLSLQIGKEKEADPTEAMRAYELPLHRKSAGDGESTGTMGTRNTPVDTTMPTTAMKHAIAPDRGGDEDPQYQADGSTKKKKKNENETKSTSSSSSSSSSSTSSTSSSTCLQ